MIGTDRAAAADEGGTDFGPAEADSSIGGRIKIVPCFEHIDRASNLQRGNTREPVGIGAERERTPLQFGQSLVDGFRQGAVEEKPFQFAMLHGIEGVRDQFPGAERMRLVIVEGEADHKWHAGMRANGFHRRERFPNAGKSLRDKEVDLGLNGDDLLICRDAIGL